MHWAKRAPGFEPKKTIGLQKAARLLYIERNLAMYGSPQRDDISSSSSSSPRGRRSARVL